MAAQRMGTAKTKTRGEVSGTGKSRGAKKAPAAPGRVRAELPSLQVAVWPMVRSSVIIRRR